jgi:cytochrome c biogenesis protein CcdA
MILLVLAYPGGVLTIVSPCILPVLPFVFARADRPYIRDQFPGSWRARFCIHFRMSERR